MNDRMTAGDWVFCFALVSIIVMLGAVLSHFMTKAERLENELARLKAECVTKGVAEYGFSNKGEVVFKIKNGSEVCGYCRPRQKGENAEGEKE